MKLFRLSFIKPPKVLLGIVFIGVTILTSTFSIHPIPAIASDADAGLVIDYNFATDPGALVKDLSGHGNDGRIVSAQWLPEVQGRKGVLRLDGNSSYVDCGKSASLHFSGDMTFEMWIRLNAPISHVDSFIFGENPYQQMMFMMAQNDSLVFRYNRADGSMVVPVTRSILSDQWSHIAVVVEYPRCRFYCDGKLIRDAYMPFPGVNDVKNYPKQIGGGKNNGVPFDLSNFKLYRRALTAEEIAADYHGQTQTSKTSEELALEPNWYEDLLTLRLTYKGGDMTNRAANFTLLDAAGKTVLPATTAKMTDVSQNASGRYAATVTFPLTSIKGQTLNAIAQIDGTNVRVQRQIALTKPAWIQNKLGYSTKVLSPWTPVQATQQNDDSVQVGIWGRQYHFGGAALLNQIQTQKSEMLNAPIALSGQVDGQEIQWQNTHVHLNKASETVAAIEQSGQSHHLSFQINSTTEFDGYTIFDCAIKADQTLSVDGLKLDIPLKSSDATLCYSDRGMPIQDKIRMTETYSGAVKGDLSFLFSQIWIGNRDIGLCWQSESDQYWNNADKQKALEVLPRGDTTFLRANFIDIPTKLEAGQVLHYKFALQATPIKPLRRDAWNLRIMRTPYGDDLHYPERTVNGEPALKFLADSGVRNLFINVNETWPWPMPEGKHFSEALQRTIQAIHSYGLKEHPYAIHIRFPVTVPEFDIYGAQMVQYPYAPYVQAGPALSNVAGNSRPGPLSVEFGADSQGALIYSPKSMAAQDAYIYSLNQRLTQFGDDGVYLDGTGQVMPDTNPLHGSGYLGKDGKIHPTYPVFACREFIKRIYTVVKQHDPNGVVDLHSWYHNPAQAAYADIILTGEQWSQLRNTGAPDGYVAAQMPLDLFQTMFTGRQTGTPVELLSYRLGSTMKVSATSLLNDVPVMLNQGGRSMETELDGTDSVDQNYFSILTKLWRVREQFDADHAQKYFYDDNQDYVQVNPPQCYSTLLHNAKTGVLAFVTNLSRDPQNVTVKFNLLKLGLAGHKVNAIDALTDKPVTLNEDGTVTLPLESEGWTYLWLQP